MIWNAVRGCISRSANRLRGTRFTSPGTANCGRNSMSSASSFVGCSVMRPRRLLAMTPRIVIVGGGSYHWAPRLLCDFANTPSLAGADVVLHDWDPDRLKLMEELGG